MYDWEVSEEGNGKIHAKLCGTEVTVCAAGEDAEGWCWEVRFADGQTQSGVSDSPESALEKGKSTAERFLP